MRHNLVPLLESLVHWKHWLCLTPRPKEGDEYRLPPCRGRDQQGRTEVVIAIQLFISGHRTGSSQPSQALWEEGQQVCGPCARGEGGTALEA